MKQNRLVKYIFSLTVMVLTAMLLSCCSKGEQSTDKAEIGKPAPDFTLTDINGKNWQLSNLRGKVVFINFWASWCAPCLEEIPSMEALNRMMPDEYFQMVTILYNDRPEYAQNVVNKSGATFPVLLDPDSEAARQYGLTGVPETFIIDTRGILREKFIGPKNWLSQDAVAMVEHYFPQSYKKIVQ